MSSYRFIERIQSPLIQNQVISALTQTVPLTTSSMSAVTFQFNYAAGINATFQILGSLDGVNFVDLNAVINPATGLAGSSIGNVDIGAILYVRAQITPSSGSAIITVLGRAATRP